MPSLPYSWWTLDEALTALQSRLQNSTFWSTAELIVYIQNSLRFWNALTESWKVSWALNNPPSLWINTGIFAASGQQTASPRLRTLTDAYLYSQMQYMLLEPATGAGTWTGTNQFDLASMQFALSKRRNEVLQAATCNLSLTTLPITPNTRTVQFADTVLDPIRARFIPAAGFGDPVWLSREDLASFDFWNPNYNQETGTPSSWDVISQTPLTVGVDLAPNVPGTIEFVTLNSGPDFAPPAATLLGLPDDWAFLPMFGALGDLLESEPERMDKARAAYCKQRFQQGLAVIRKANFMVDDSHTQGATDVLSLAKADFYDPGWDAATSNGGWPQTIVAGMDFIALPNTPSTNLTLVGNQPVPSAGGDFIQIGRDVADMILDYAQHLAAFKQGGSLFQQTIPLYQGFMKAAAETNKRIEQLGLNYAEMAEVGRQEQIDVPRQ